MATLVWPLLVAVVGVLIYALASGKLSEAGRIAYFCGLLWTVWLVAGRAFHF